MIDSIENDGKFRKLFSRYLSELTELSIAELNLDLRRKADMLKNGLESRLYIECKEINDKSKTTLSHIFKYIDRRVERAVLEERNAQEAGQTSHKQSIELMNFKASGPLKGSRSEMEMDRLKTLYENSIGLTLMTISADGMCRINVRNRNTSDYDIITRFLYKEIAKINPSVLLINDKYIDYEQTLCDLALGVKERSIYIVFGFGDSRIDLSFRSTNMWVEINLPEIAKYFSDEVNKIARNKYIGI